MATESASLIQFIMLIGLMLLNANNEFDFNVDDVCLSEFHIEKYTMASSDSYRDTEMTLLIFAEASSEYAPHFEQDLCARASKVNLPYSCFKIHAPQTWQHQEGYLFIESLENEFSKKFYSVINGYSSFQFDAFFDYNLGLYVLNLHKYLKQINDHSSILTNYIGLKWYYPQPIDKTFYSLIIQSPSSQKIYELISFNKPDLSLYPNLRKNFKFTKINELRASFLSQYPWDREDGADIIPIKISFGCSDINENVEFYTNVLEAKLLYREENIISTLDGHTVSYAFLQPINDEIEIEYVQRPIDYTYGEFTTEIYKNLLINTHNDRITSPVCGLDRWFDNHYGYNTVKFATDSIHYNYMDRVLSHILQRGMKWRLYHTPYQDDSPEAKYWMKQYGFDDLYTLYIFDMNGQTIQMFGVFRDYNIPFIPPIYHKQWCYAPCPGHQEMGQFDQNQIYVEDTDDIVYKIIIQEKKKYDRNNKIEDVKDIVDNDANIVEEDDTLQQEIDIIDSSYHRKANIYIATVACITIGVVACIMVIFCVYRCIMRPTNTHNYDSDYVHAEILPLLLHHHHKRRG